MNTNEIIGSAVAVGIPLMVSIFALIRPIINLNTSITELNVTIKQLTKENNDMHETLGNHTEKLEDHEKRIYLIEHKGE